MWNPFKKSKAQQTEEKESIMTNEELESLRLKAYVEAENIYRQIYKLFKERINELKKDDNFILFQENSIKICDDKDLNRHLIYEYLYGDCLHFNRLPELSFACSKVGDDVSLCYEKYYLYTIKISHDDTIEIYYIKFKVHPSPQEINNGNEICVTVHSVDKTIYKLILLNNYDVV